jgi:hypothetical protein
MDSQSTQAALAAMAKSLEEMERTLKLLLEKTNPKREEVK